MPRTFAGSPNFITCAVGQVPQTSANISVGAIVLTSTVTVIRNFLAVTDATNYWTLGHSATGTWWFAASGAGSAVTTTTISSTTAYFVGMSKASGNTAPRFHWVPMGGGSFIHENTAGTLTDNAAQTSPNIIIGRGASTNYWWGDVAVLGIWDSVLTDAQFEQLPRSLAGWFQVQPKALWVLDQASVAQSLPDLSGHGSDQSAISGTSVASASVPFFSYGVPTEKALIQPAAAVGGNAGPRDLLLLRAG